MKPASASATVSAARPAVSGRRSAVNNPRPVVSGPRAAIEDQAAISGPRTSVAAQIEAILGEHAEVSGPRPAVEHRPRRMRSNTLAWLLGGITTGLFLLLGYVSYATGMQNLAARAAAAEAPAAEGPAAVETPAAAGTAAVKPPSAAPARIEVRALPVDQAIEAFKPFFGEALAFPESADLKFTGPGTYLVVLQNVPSAQLLQQWNQAGARISETHGPQSLEVLIPSKTAFQAVQAFDVATLLHTDAPVSPHP